MNKIQTEYNITFENDSIIVKPITKINDDIIDWGKLQLNNDDKPIFEYNLKKKL